MSDEPITIKELKFELVTMKWICIDCRAKFDGPTNRAPANGCPVCGSRNVLDINLGPIGPNNPQLS